jgi:hypothetical protein
MRAPWDAKDGGGSVVTMSVLGPILALKTLHSLSGLEPSIFEPDPDIAVADSDARFVAARYAETVIRGRPWVPHKRVATISKGTRLVVRGEVESRDDAGCEGKPWYAVYPFGYVCSTHVTKSDRPPELGSAMPVSPGKRLPHAYALVRNDGAPQYANTEMAELGISERVLTRGMSLVVANTVDVGGLSYVQTRDGKLVAKSDVGWMGQGSEWRGVVLDGFDVGPAFGWVSANKVVPRKEPASDAAKADESLELRQRVPILEVQGDWRKIGDEAWLRADDLNEVIITEPPPDVLTEFRLEQTGNDQWFDVDVGEQVLVAYRGTDPVYATLVSSGRGHPTPLGNYPMWAKVASMDMANQDYEDKPYMVQGVPWVVLFQAHNALHGAYWHDRFGNRKSHGCVNLAPLDARWVFEWVGPDLPTGWTGYLPYDLHKSPVVHVRDSSKDAGMTFTQERPWGPPDREAEREKVEKAEARRALAAAEPEPAKTGVLPPPGEGGARVEPPPMMNRFGGR